MSVTPPTGSEQTVSAALTAEFIQHVAAQCKPGEAAVAFVTAAEGPSYCVASEQTARASAAASAAATPDELDGDTLLAVAVIAGDGTLTEYPIAA